MFAKAASGQALVFNPAAAVGPPWSGSMAALRAVPVAAPRWWRPVIAVVLLGVFFAGPAAGATPAAKVRSAAEQIAREIDAAAAAGSFDVQAAQAAVERLGQLALRFTALADGVMLAGDEKRQAKELSSVYEAVVGPLRSVYAQNAGSLERMTQQIIDADGDLEALYETKAWRGAQLLASHALYYLDWLYLYGARLRPDTERTALLEQAEQGFSQFAVAEKESVLQVESLLGRGLAHLELGHTKWAVRDFERVLASKLASAEWRQRAKVALVDAHARGGDLPQVLQVSKRFLSAGAGKLGRDGLARVRYLRAQALLQMAARGGADAARSRREAAALVELLRRRGGKWQQRAEALLLRNMHDPSRWVAAKASPFARWAAAKMLIEKRDYAAAKPLLQSVLTSASARQYREEATYLLGLAEFETGNFAAAAERLAPAASAAGGRFAAAAAYLRFKALEAWLGRKPDAAVLADFQQAAMDYATAYPDHQSVYEAHLRLGELRQAEGRFAEAIARYAQVRGDPVFEIRAKFATLQCYFELLGSAGASQEQREAWLGRISALLPALDQQAAELQRQGGEVPAIVTEVRAKSTVLEAAYYGLRGGRDAETIRLLRGYEERYPQMAELFPSVVRRRLEAMARLGKWADAAAEARAHGQVFRTAEQQATASALARRFANAATRAEQSDAGADARAAAHAAAALYEIAVDVNNDEPAKVLALAQLYDRAGDAEHSRRSYRAVLERAPRSLGALRGLAQLAERQRQVTQSLRLWKQFLAAAHPGDPPWYEGHYEVARLTLARGERKESCAQLAELRPAFAGAGSGDLRRRLEVLYKEACR